MSDGKFTQWWNKYLEKIYGQKLFNEDGSPSATYFLSNDLLKKKREFLLAWNACKAAYGVGKKNGDEDQNN